MQIVRRFVNDRTSFLKELLEEPPSLFDRNLNSDVLLEGVFNAFAPGSGETSADRS